MLAVSHVWSIVLVCKLKAFGCIETVKVDSRVEGLQILFVVGFGVELKDFYVQAANVLYVYPERNFLLDFENFFVRFAELQLNLICDRLVEVKVDFAFIERFQTVLSKVYFCPFLNIFQVRLLEVTVKSL